MTTTIVLRIEVVDAHSSKARPSPRPLSPEAAQILLAAAERMRVAMREHEEQLPSGRGPLSFLGIHPRAW
jgi:hypothetical protein